MSFTFSIISKPANLEPAFQNSVPFVVQSTLATYSQFKYIYDFYSGYTPDTLTYSTTVASYPRTNSGIGVLSVKQFLRDQLNPYDGIDPTISTYIQSTHSSIYYKVDFSQSYPNNATFSNIINAAPIIGSPAYPALLFPTNPGYLYGDILSITLDNSSLNPSYNTTASIIYQATYSTYWAIVVNIPYGTTPTYLQTGYIQNVATFVTSSSILLSYNGIEQYEEQGKDWSSYLIQPSTTNKFLSTWSASVPKPVYYNNDCKSIATFETIDFMMGTFSWTNNSFGFKITSYDANNQVLATYSLPIATSFKDKTPRLRGPVGPGNLGGYGSLFTITPDHYTIQLMNNTTAWSEIRTYKPIPQSREYDIVILMFLNKFGGYDYYQFHLVNKYTSNVSRSMINRSIPYDYNVGYRGGQTIINQDITTTYTIETDYIDDISALYLQGLVESPEVYVLYPFENTDITTIPKPIPVVMATNNYDFKSTLNNQLNQYELQFTIAPYKLSNI